MALLKPEGLVDNLYKYVETRIELAKVEAQYHAEQTLRKVIAWGILAVLICIVVLFCLLGLALFLNYYWNSAYLGFLWVGIGLGVSGLGIIVLLRQEL